MSRAIDERSFLVYDEFTKSASIAAKNVPVPAIGSSIGLAACEYLLQLGALSL
jgi:hypothetical protein